MNNNTILKVQNLKIIAVIASIIGIFSLSVSLLQTPQYKSSAKLIVVFNQENMDIYTAAQTSNYIANILGEVVYSKSFMDSVLASNFDLKDDFGFDPDKRIKNWKKTVKVEILENKGIILIDVYHSDKNQANQFAQAISYVLITKHQSYHGSGDKIALKIIDSSVTAEKWAKPQIWQNTLLGLLAGLILGLTFVVIFPEQKVLEYIEGRLAEKKRQKNQPDEEINFNLENHQPVEPLTDLNTPQPQETKTENTQENNQDYNW